VRVTPRRAPGARGAEPCTRTSVARAICSPWRATDRVQAGSRASVSKEKESLSQRREDAKGVFFASSRLCERHYSLDFSSPRFAEDHPARRHATPRSPARGRLSSAVHRTCRESGDASFTPLTRGCTPRSVARRACCSAAGRRLEVAVLDEVLGLASLQKPKDSSCQRTIAVKAS